MPKADTRINEIYPYIYHRTDITLTYFLTKQKIGQIIVEQFITLVAGATGGGAIFWLLRNWISERLKQSIGYEYSQKLESYKTELNSKVESLRHDYQIAELRTSLFFDHQREGYLSILSKIAEINEAWGDLYERDVGLFAAVPYQKYQALKALINKHQLFLDEDCLMVLSLIKDIYESSFPFEYDREKPPHQNESSSLLGSIEYIQPRLASIFRGKIGMHFERIHLQELAILSAIRLVNSYHFLEVGVPPKGNLSIKKIENASDMVLIGSENIDELKSLLDAFSKYMKSHGGWLQEDQLKIKRCIDILTRVLKSS